MEHFVFRLVVRFVHHLNQRSQRSLPELVADYPALLADPDRALREHPVHIAGAQRYGSVLVGTALLWMIASLVVCAGVADLDINPPAARRPIAILLLVVWSVAPFASWFAAKRFLASRAGIAVLNRDGVTMACRNEMVFCPWELFATIGKPVCTSRTRVLVPVAAEALPDMVVQRNGNVDYSGTIQTRLLTYESGNQIALRQLYQVDVGEMASLFLHMGKVFGRTQAVKGHPRETVAFEVKQDSGWIRAQVSRLNFPPQCCSCGAPPSGKLVIRTSTPLYRRAFDDRRLALHVPICAKCLQDNKRRRRPLVLRGFLFAALLFPALFLLTGLLAIAAPGLAVVGVLATIIVPLVVGSRAIARSRRVAAPVQARRWNPRDGTVQLRFLWHAYGEAALAGRSV
jgi:hypothetical protein